MAFGKTERAIRQLRQQNQNQEVRTPIATEMFLPNHSGISAHQEAKNNFAFINKINTFSEIQTFSQTIVSPHAASQPARALDTVYQNTNAYPIIVYGSVKTDHRGLGDQAHVLLKTDSSNPPTTVVQNVGWEGYLFGSPTHVENYFPFWMVVQPNHYYTITKVVNGGSALTLQYWNEVNF